MPVRVVSSNKAAHKVVMRQAGTQVASQPPGAQLLTLVRESLPRLLLRWRSSLLCDPTALPIPCCLSPLFLLLCSAHASQHSNSRIYRRGCSRGPRGSMGTKQHSGQRWTDAASMCLPAASLLK